MAECEQDSSRGCLRAPLMSQTVSKNTALMHQNDLNQLEEEEEEEEAKREILVKAPLYKLNTQSISKTMSRWMRSSETIPLTLVLIVVVCCISSHLINCQQSEVPVSNQQFSAEARADPPSQPQTNALDQLVKFINNYANQQSAFGAPNNRRPLPMNNQRIPQAASQQTSTPLNPFGAPAPQFQSNRQRVNFPAQPVAGNNQLFVPSSPATPYLTLNRIPSTQNQNANPNGNPNRPFNGPIQPLNTIPLGGRLQPGRLMPSGGARVAQRPAQAPQLSPTWPASSTPVPQAGPSSAGPVKPLTGFAPSGPPPSSLSAGNNALVVVQSPANPIGQQTTSSTEPSTVGGASNKTENPTTASEERPKETTTASPAPASSTPTAPNDDNVAHESTWNPVEANKTEPAKSKASLAPSPDIVTVPPGYNPDSPAPPQSYDIAVSAQMGGAQAPKQSSESYSSSPSWSPNSAAEPTPSQVQSVATQTPPTAVTTIIWSPPASEAAPPSASISPSTSAASIEPTRVAQIEQTRPSVAPPTRIRDNSLSEPSEPAQPEAGVVYGRAPARDAKPGPPISPSPISGQASIESSVAGRPFIQPVQIDNQVRPFSAGAQPASGEQGQALLKSNHLPFKPSRPMGSNGQTPLHVGSGFTITANGNQTMPTGDIQDYVAGQPPLLDTRANQPAYRADEPTISAQGGQDPASEPAPEHPATPASADTPISSAAPAVRARRPTFKPRPAVPTIRIDSCIVGDDSSCNQTANERCLTEYGISSCHCKPGHARLSLAREHCYPVSSLQLSFKIDKLSDDRRLAFNQSLNNSNSEEYQYLEFETIQAIAGAFQQTAFSKQFMGARVNKFFEKNRKVWANISINLGSHSNQTKAEAVPALVAQELHKVTSNSRQKPIGDSTIMLDGSKEAFSRLVDVNECASKELNDCSKYATCINDFGAFQCQCLPGYEDKYLSEEKSKQGRVCLGCTASYCSNRGECYISEGQKHCKCRANFVGARCDIDSEVLAVAVGGSLVGIIILIITFWCLFVFNRRWKREQQKMDAMSATSGLTFNYVNSSTNSLMSPTRNIVGGLHRSGGQQVGALAANYGQRFGAALVNGTRGAQQFAPDQQAIIGSTSSGSSAASQPIGCNPYAAQYQYEDAGLLIAPASTGSSEQTSPSSNSYRGVMGANHAGMMSQLAGNAYTLSGHHHHHHHHPHQHQHQQLQHHHHHHGHANKSHPQITQFHPAAANDYRTLNSGAHCNTNGHYDARWRTLQQDASKQSALVGYYLSPDMLMGQQQQQNLQQLYASPQRELCIDTGGSNNNNKSRRTKQVRATSGDLQTLRSRSQTQLNVAHLNHTNYHASDYDHERPI